MSRKQESTDTLSVNTDYDFNTREEIQEVRIWLLILNSALHEEEVNKELAQNSIKEIVSILSQISFIYNLWPSMTGDGDRNVG
jgi:hypothetical protein